MFGNGFLFCLAAAASYPLGAFVLAAQQLHGLGNKQAFLLGFNHVKRLQQLQRSQHDVRICASDSTENLRCAIDAAILEQLALSLNRFEHQLEIEDQDAVPIGNACDDADAVIFKEVFFQANPVIPVFTAGWFLVCLCHAAHLLSLIPRKSAGSCIQRCNYPFFIFDNPLWMMIFWIRCKAGGFPRS